MSTELGDLEELLAEVKKTLSDNERFLQSLVSDTEEGFDAIDGTEYVEVTREAEGPEYS